MRTIHTRMPIILDAKSGRAWIDAAASEDALHAMLTTPDGVELRAHEVSRMVNNPANDRAECIDPMELDESPVLPTEPAREAFP